MIVKFGHGISGFFKTSNFISVRKLTMKVLRNKLMWKNYRKESSNINIELEKLNDKM